MAHQPQQNREKKTIENHEGISELVYVAIKKQITI